MRRCALRAALLAATVLSVAGLPPRPSRAAPAPPNPIQPMDPVPSGLHQSWVAGFKLSGHFFRPGQRISGTITIKVSQCLGSNGGPCYRGTDWSYVIGSSKKCGKMSLTCSWYAGDASVPHWVVVDMPIANTIGPADSADYYAVVGKNTYTIDGHVTDTAGDPIAGMPIIINGTKNASASTDSTGYYYAFLPKGTYSVSVGTATRYFNPPTKNVTLTSSATVDFEGAIHTTTSLSKTSVDDNGLETAALTIHAYSPTGQPIANHPLHVDVAPTSGAAAAVVCSAMPSYTGRIAPAGLALGSPYYVPVNQPTDSTGTLTYQVYFGSAPGKIVFSADDPSVTGRNGPGNVSSFSSVEATITSIDRTAFPVLYPVVIHHALRTTTEHLFMAGALTAIVQGLTVDLPQNQLVPSPLNLNGAGGDAQKILLRAIEASHVFDGLGIAPISGAGGSHPGVLIYVPNHLGNNNATAVLDIATAQALIKDDLHRADLAVHLPTRGAWESSIVGGPSILDYAGPEPEQGLTYLGGLPYLPVADADLATFDATCAARAASS